MLFWNFWLGSPRREAGRGGHGPGAGSGGSGLWKTENMREQVPRLPLGGPVSPELGVHPGKLILDLRAKEL